jgi:uncharacterized membrane protein
VKPLVGHLRAHPHLVVSGVLGAVAALAATGVDNLVARCLVGWNVGVWFYLAWTGWTMTHSDQTDLKRVAVAQAEGATTVLSIVALGALASFGAIFMELAAAKASVPKQAWPHVLFTLATVTGSWLLVPTLFSLNYASLYHVSAGDNGGLKFPEQAPDFEPDYGDFLYFSFTIAVASQTADVTISSRPMRRLVLLQSVLSFVFNTTILAFTINIAASLI